MPTRQASGLYEYACKESIDLCVLCMHHNRMNDETAVSKYAAQGGKARAESLSALERSEISRQAALTRWERAGKTPMPRATHMGELRIGDVVIPCAVLDDERRTRVLSRIEFIRAIGRTGKAKGGRKYDDESKIPVFLTADNLKPFISISLIENAQPVPYIPLIGGSAIGYKSDLLPQVCGVFLDADAANSLQPNQKHIAQQCRILLKGFATVGITALIDEATGFQDERSRDALAKILEAFIAKELRPWVCTFPADFYKELCRLRGIPYTGTVRRPQYIGHLTNDLIYRRLAPGVLDELGRLTPRDEKGRLKNHLHRRLTEDLGHPKLLQHLAAVTALMKVADTWKQFRPLVDKALPHQTRMPLFDGMEPIEHNS